MGEHRFEAGTGCLVDLRRGEVGQVGLCGLLLAGCPGGRLSPQAPDEDCVEVACGCQLDGAAVPGVPELHVQHGQGPLQAQVLVGAYRVVDVLGLSLADVVGLQDALHVAGAAGERPQRQEVLDLPCPVGVCPGLVLLALELLVVGDDRLGHLAASGGGPVEQLLVVHVAHDRVPRQHDVTGTYRPTCQEGAQGPPVLDVRQGPQGVAVLEEVGGLLGLPGLAQGGRIVVHGVPLQAHGLGHLP